MTTGDDRLGDDRTSALSEAQIEQLIQGRQGRRRTASSIETPALGDSVEVKDRPWRGIAIGLVGVAALSYVSVFSKGYIQASGLSDTYLPTGVFILFLLILGLNTALRRFGWGLTTREIMLAYVTMLISSAIPTTGLAMRLTPFLVIPYYYATPINEWAILHLPHIPTWMTPHGDDVVLPFFRGLPRGASIPWGAWITPLAFWSLLAASLYLILMGLAIIFRRRWMDAERLQFPLAQVPLMIMGDDPNPSWASAFFRNPLVWIGIAIPLILHSINGLHLYFPVIPEIKLTEVNLQDLMKGSRFITDLPFSRWAGVQFNFYWSVIGISYLLRTEVSLAVWVFEWFYRFEEIAFELIGIGYGQHNWSPLHTFGYTMTERYGRLGATVTASAMFLWASRSELREMVLAAFGRREPSEAGADVAEIPWWTFWALVGGTAIYFAWTAAAGVGLLISVTLLILFVLVATVTARIVAATGLLWVYDYFVAMQGLQKLVGTARIDPQTFTMVGMIDYGVLHHRANIMPQVLDGMKIARQSGITQKHYFIGVVLGLFVAAVVSFGVVIWMGYHYGATNLNIWYFFDSSDWLFNRVAAYQRFHVWTDWRVVGVMGAGGVFMVGLMWLHRTFLWWPLYPLGFIIGGTVASRQIWFPVFLGWLAKTLVLRFAGSQMYNKLKPVALGLLIGEFSITGIWLAIDWATGKMGHLVFPRWSGF
jgi:hypothetical protein